MGGVSSAPVLSLNVGSSSIKAALLGDGPRVDLEVDRLGTPEARLQLDGRPAPTSLGEGVVGAFDAVLQAVRDLGRDPVAVAHRVVQGGLRHAAPTRVDEALLTELDALVPYAPLHLPPTLQVLRKALARLPDAVHVACFDTALWRALPDVAQRLPVPAEVHDLGVQRYGFHGLSVQHVLDVLGWGAGAAGSSGGGPSGGGRLVVAHLGSGCSVSALRDGRPLHTSMSFTPSGGLMSRTRSGDLDPHVVLTLLQQHGWSVDRVRGMLDTRAGLAGLAGGDGDVRDLLARRSADPVADLALRSFVRAVAMEIAACTAVLGGLDTLVFTGGIGEHAGPVRAEIRSALAHLGVPPEGAGNGGPVRCLVVPADEQAVLDRQARLVLR